MKSAETHPTPPHVMEAINAVAAWLREIEAVEVHIRPNGGAAYQLETHTDRVGSLLSALDAAHNDKIESVAIVKAEAAVNWSIASYALEQWEEWVDSELENTATYADTKAEIANLRASLGMGREGGEEKG